MEMKGKFRDTEGQVRHGKKVEKIKCKHVNSGPKKLGAEEKTGNQVSVLRTNWKKVKIGKGACHNASDGDKGVERTV